MIRGRESGVIRPFGLTDVLLVRRLQRTGAALAIEHILTHPRAPLWIALTAPWPWAGVGVATYVLTDRGSDGLVAGFVQLIKRTARPEADVLHLAPALTAAPAGEDIWAGLLTHCIRAAGSHGLQRVYVSIPDGGPEEACLKEVGYSLYTRETIYRLAVVPPVAHPRGDHFPRDGRDRGGLLGAGSGAPLALRRDLPAGFRPQLPQDSWALQRLYAKGTPHLVQQAEGAGAGQVGSPPLSWWEPDRWQGIVLEPAGEVRGAVQVHIGRAGHWLRVWGTNVLAARELRALIEQGLRLISVAQPGGGHDALPVYVTVRDYEVGLASALTGFGFAPFSERARFVKHTAAAVRAATPVVRAVREVRQEVPARSQMLFPG